MLSDDTTSHLWHQKQASSGDEEPRRFKPFSRTNSLDVVKQRCVYPSSNHHIFRTDFRTVVIAWVSTRRGDATACAILLVVTLMCLIQIQRYLIAGSEVGASDFDAWPHWREGHSRT
jgi:hypothetical protein